jgi:hypothetical protein
MASTVVSTPSSKEYLIYCLGDYLYIEILPNTVLKIKKSDERNYHFVENVPSEAVIAQRLDHWDCKKTTPEEKRWDGAAGPVRNLIGMIISLKKRINS